MPREVNDLLTPQDISQADYEDFLDKITSGILSPVEIGRVKRKLDLGVPYEDAFRGWSGFFQRSGLRVGKIPEDIAEAAKGGFGIDHLLGLQKQHGIGFGTAAWIAEIAEGSTVGMLRLGKELVLGHGDMADAIEILATAMPAARIANSVKLAKGVKAIQTADPLSRAKGLAEAVDKTRNTIARKLMEGDTSPTPHEIHKLGDLQITEAEFRYLQQAGAIDRTLEYTETALEAVEIIFNPDELLQTVAWGGAGRLINQLIRRGSTPEIDQLGGLLPPVEPQGIEGTGIDQGALPAPGQQAIEGGPIVTPPPETDPQAIEGGTLGQTALPAPAHVTPPPSEPLVTPPPGHTDLGGAVTEGQPDDGTQTTTTETGSEPTPQGTDTGQPDGSQPTPTTGTPTTGTPTTGTPSGTPTTGTPTVGQPSGTPTQGTPTTGTPTTGTPTTDPTTDPGTPEEEGQTPTAPPELRVVTKTKGQQIFRTEIDGDTVEINVNSFAARGHGNVDKVKSVKITREGYAPQTIEIDSHRYNQAAIQALSHPDLKWKKINLDAEPTPDVGNVIQIPTTDGSLEYYYQNPDDPTDVVLMKVEKTESDSKTIRNKVFADNKEISGTLALYLSDPTDPKKRKELHDALIRNYGEQSAKTRARDIGRLLSAMQGDRTQYTVNAKRDGFKTMRTTLDVGSDGNLTDTLQSAISSIQWKPGDTPSEPNMSPISEAEEVTATILDDAAIAVRMQNPVVYEEGVIVDELPTQEYLIAGETVRGELLGMAQSLKAGQRIHLHGRKVRSIHELMAISQWARDGRVESSYAVYVDSNGVVIAQDILSNGLVESVTGNAAGVDRIVETIKNNPDIDKVYTMHNHPSASPIPSRDDFRVGTVLKQWLEDEGLGHKYGGEGVHDSGAYSVILDDEHYVLNIKLNKEERGWDKDPVLSPVATDERARAILGKKLDGVIDNIKQFRSDEGKVTFIGMDVPIKGSMTFSQQRPEMTIKTVWTLDNLDKVDPSDINSIKEFNNAILNHLRINGGAHYIAVFDDPNIKPAVLSELKNTWNMDVYGTANITDLDNYQQRDAGNRTSAATSKIGRHSGTHYFYRRMNNLTERRLLDPRNGFSPQTKDATQFAEQLKRITEYDKSHKILDGANRNEFSDALVKTRAANLHHDDMVLVIGNSEMDLGFASIRNDANGNPVATNNVAHIESIDSGFGGESPHVIIAQELSDEQIQKALEMLSDDGRLVYSEYPGHVVLDKVTPEQKTAVFNTTYPEKIEDARSTRLPIDRRSRERVALEQQEGITASEPTLTKSDGQELLPRGIGEPGETVYTGDLEPGSPIDYLLTEDPDAQLGIDREAETVGGVSPSVDAPDSQTIPNRIAQQGTETGAIGTPSEQTSSPSTMLESDSNVTQGGLRTEGLLLEGQDGTGIAGEQQSFGNNQRSRTSVLSERRRNAAPYTASASPQAKTTVEDTAFGKFTEISGGKDRDMIKNESDALSDVDKDMTEEQKERWADKFTRSVDNTKQMFTRDNLGELRDSVRDQWKNSRVAYQFLKTGNKALKDMGITGQEILIDIKDITDSSDKLRGNFDLLLEKKKAELNRLFIEEIKEKTRDPEYKGNGADWINGELVAAMERTREVDPAIQDAVEEIREFLDVHFSQPMLDMNMDILSDPIISDMPVEWVDGTAARDLILRRRQRTTPVGDDLPLFQDFMRKTGNIDRLVLDVEGQHIYALIKETKTRKRGDRLVVVDDWKLKSALGSEIPVAQPENLPFKGEHQIIVNNVDGEWQGDLDAAERVWDAEVRNTPSVESMRAEFERQGLIFPENPKLEFEKYGELDQWNLYDDDGNVLYKLRYIGNNEDGGVSTHPIYDEFRGRLMLLEPGARDPIMIHQGSKKSHMWQPLDDYFPHMVPWKKLNFHKNKLDNYALEYASRFYEANKDKVDSLQQALEILGREQMRIKSKKYGHLEQARIYNYPDYNTSFFEVLEAFGNMAAERQHVIKNFGQDFDLLHAQLDKLLSPVHLRDQMPANIQAIIKLRQAQGYKDFTRNQFAARTGNKFMPDGNPAIIDSQADKYRHLSTQDWQELLNNGILIELSDGQYQINENQLSQLEMPGLTDQTMRQAYSNYSIAADVVSRQYGITTADIWEEDLSKISRAMRETTGLFLTKSWTAQIGQLANTAISAGIFNTIRAVARHAKQTAQASLAGGYRDAIVADAEYARTIGAVPIDVTQWFTSETSLVSAILAPRTEYHWYGTGLKELAKNKLSTPFMAMEKYNRVISATAGRDHAMFHLKRLIDDPTNKLSLAELETLSPYADHLNRKLGDLLERVKNMAIESSDIDWVMKAPYEQIQSQRPELESVRDYINSYAKAMADLTQHRLTPADRIRAISTNPILKVAFSLQSFMIKQTEFMWNAIKREANIINRAYINPQAGVGGRTLGAARGILARSALSSTRLLGGAGFGLLALSLGHAIRGKRTSDEENLLKAALGQIALAGILGQIYNSRQHEHGTGMQMLGPILGTGADFVDDPKGTLGKVAKSAAPFGSHIFDK